MKIFFGGRGLTFSLISLSSFLLLGPMIVQAQQGPDQAVMQLLQSGAAAMHAGKPADAEKYFRQAVAAAPKQADAYLGLGMSQLREGKIDDAESALSKAVELDTQLPGAYMFLGIAQFQSHDFDAATGSLKQAVIQKPDDVEALTWLGIVEIDAGHPDEAVGPLDRAAALRPKDPNVLDYRGRAHSLVAQESYAALTALDPDSWRVHRALGEVYAGSKDWEAALTEYIKASAKQPDNPDLLEALGDTYQRLHRFDEASHAYEAELKLSPHNPTALYNLGKMQVQNGDAQRGVELLRQAVDAHAPAAPSYLYLGKGLADTGHPEEAVVWLEKSLSQESSSFVTQSVYFELVRVYKMLNRTEDAMRAANKLKSLKDTTGAPAAATDKSK
ncbi:MAG: tetratricopeptide repeat protein [Terracidiphilus sp.]|jgi:tetratricopeptide (TPR) repeat protein